MIEVVNRQGGVPFTDDDLRFLETLAGSIAVAVENARLHARIKASEEKLRVQVGRSGATSPAVTGSQR